MSDAESDIQDYAGFFVAMDECVFCGVCHGEAPDNFRWTNKHYTNSRGEREKYLASEIYKQPATEEEMEGIASAIQLCCAECIKYGGFDAEIVEYLLRRDVQPCSIVQLDEIDLKEK